MKIKVYDYTGEYAIAPDDILYRLIMTTLISNIIFDFEGVKVVAPPFLNAFGQLLFDIEAINLTEHNQSVWDRVIEAQRYYWSLDDEGRKAYNEIVWQDIEDESE